MSEVTVKVNQVWQDWDVRFRNSTPRRIKVVDIIDGIATCVNLDTHKITKIRVSRLKPNSTGYKLMDNDGEMDG